MWARNSSIRQFVEDVCGRLERWSDGGHGGNLKLQNPKFRETPNIKFQKDPESNHTGAPRKGWEEFKVSATQRAVRGKAAEDWPHSKKLSHYLDAHLDSAKFWSAPSPLPLFPRSPTLPKTFNRSPEGLSVFEVLN